MVIFGVCKDLSYSNREGIDEKLKYKQKQYKMKVLKKNEKLCIFGPIGLVMFY